VKNYASAEQIIIFRAGEVSIRHFIGMPLILAERTVMNLQTRKREKKIFFYETFFTIILSK
jgi:hypothetical protein